MTQENKELLIIDLCARLPYGTRVSFNGDAGIPRMLTSYDIYGSECYFCAGSFTGLKAENIKPYLRPMSSMTEEEADEFRLDNHYRFYIGHKFSLNCEDGSYSMPLMLMRDYIDWLNKKGFDYRGLIEKGLALEAPEGMYNTK